MDQKDARLEERLPGMQLYDPRGRRLYLDQAERAAFMEAAQQERALECNLCLILALTGCRISEALHLIGPNIDTHLQVIVFETLKRRQRGVFRHVPIPSELMHQLIATCLLHQDVPVLPISRNTAWRYVKRVMARAGVEGAHATPKGLRHGFGVAAIQAGVPLNLVQRWLGHAQISTTAIYTSAYGPEERALAERMWGGNFCTENRGKI